MGARETTVPLLEFLDDAGQFLAAAGDHLRANPLMSTVVATIAERTVRDLDSGVPPPEDDWWLVVRDEDGSVVGVGMRTAPFAPRPLYLLPMPDAAAVALAHALHERGEEVLGVNGALPAAELCARELAVLTEASAETVLHMRLHVLGNLRPPRPVDGHLVQAGEEDLDLVVEWFNAFEGEADEQAGRPRGSGPHEPPPAEDILRWIRNGGMWFWVTGGERVHLTGVTLPSYGVVRIGPVYTPPGQRGRGWASNAVAEVSRRVVERGDRACLFTDQANPTSNKVYRDLGYEPVVDTASVVLRPSLGPEPSTSAPRSEP